jgi:predicted DNA-binding antitoxin AbrB/MazE fold protein
MITQFTAVYEHRVLRPTEPVSLEEGSEVEVFIISKLATPDQRTPAEILGEIASVRGRRRAARPLTVGEPYSRRDVLRCSRHEKNACHRRA